MVPSKNTAKRLLLSLLLGCTWFFYGEHAGGAEQKNETILLVSDPETNDLLESVGSPLLVAAGFSPEQVRFHVIVKESINAFALPNNHIVFHSGLVLAVQTRDELAGVMAHEIAHLASGHHTKMESEARGVSIRTLIAAAAGLAAGAVAGNGKLAEAAIVGGVASGQSTLLDSMRQKEAQADRLGIHYLAEAGYDTQGMPAFLDRLVHDQRLTALPPPYLLTHPVTAQRVTEAKEQSERIRAAQIRPDETLPLLLRVQAKLQADSGPDPTDMVTSFQKRLETHPNDFPARYGLALALRNAGRLPESARVMERLFQGGGQKDAYLLRERGLLRREMGDLPGAEADFYTAWQLKSKDVDLRYHLAMVWVEQQRYEEAGRLLRQLTNERPDTTSAFYLLGLAEEKLQRPGPSHLALARYYGLTAEYDSAIWHLHEAMRIYPSTSAEWQNAQAELQRIRKERPPVRKSSDRD